MIMQLICLKPFRAPHFKSFSLAYKSNMIWAKSTFFSPSSKLCTSRLYISSEFVLPPALYSHKIFPPVMNSFLLSYSSKSCPFIKTFLNYTQQFAGKCLTTTSLGGKKHNGWTTSPMAYQNYLFILLSPSLDFSFLKDKGYILFVTFSPASRILAHYLLHSRS